MVSNNNELEYLSALALMNVSCCVLLVVFSTILGCSLDSIMVSLMYQLLETYLEAFPLGDACSCYSYSKLHFHKISPNHNTFSIPKWFPMVHESFLYTHKILILRSLYYFSFSFLLSALGSGIILFDNFLTFIIHFPSTSRP